MKIDRYHGYDTGLHSVLVNHRHAPVLVPSGDDRSEGNTGEPQRILGTLGDS